MFFEDAAAWDAWLAEHHATAGEAWLRIAKKASGVRSVSAAEGTEVAMCHGWIDGQRRSLDESFFAQRYSPRRPKAAWSRINVERVEALIAAGRMRPAGYAQVEAAKADGRWDAAYESQREATVPADLAEALAAAPGAAAAFEGLGRTERYLLLLGLAKTRTANGRAERIRRTVAGLAGD